VTLTKLDFDIDSRRGIFQEYSADLMNYLDFIGKHKKDPTIRYLKTYYLYKLIEKWQPTLGFNEAKIQEHLLDIQTPNLEYKTSLTIKDILNAEDTQSSWLIPSLLQSCGMYILGGDPKTGKSILAYALCYAVAVSGEFLGLPVKRGNVLYLQLEEPLQTIKKRFRLAGFGDLENDENASLVVNFQDNRLRIERAFDITTDVNWLIKKIEDYKPDLVIIDSLRKATIKSPFSENSNEYGKLVYALQQVFNMTNTCGVVIHHLSKYGQDSKKKYNLVERLAGHTSISAASDGLIGLFDETVGSTRQLTLKTRPRDGFGIEIKYTSETTPEGLWEFKRIDTESPAKLISTSQILRYLSSKPEEYVSTSEIAKELSVSISNPEFLEGLHYLVELEIIKAKFIEKRRYYTMPLSGLWIVNPVSIKSLVSGAIIDANNLMRCSTKSALRELVKDWSTSKRRDAFVVLLPEEKVRIEQLIQSWQFEIGDSCIDITDGSECVIEYRIGEPTSLNDNIYQVSNHDGEWEIEEHLLRSKEILFIDKLEVEQVIEDVPEIVAIESSLFGDDNEEPETHIHNP
jgi:KaiC/GvpD/RAD55 family RecA-like ATPase